METFERFCGKNLRNTLTPITLAESLARSRPSVIGWSVPRTVSLLRNFTENGPRSYDALTARVSTAYLWYTTFGLSLISSTTDDIWKLT